MIEPWLDQALMESAYKCAICPEILQDPPGHAVGQVYQVGSHHLQGVEKNQILHFFSLKGLIITWS